MVKSVLLIGLGRFGKHIALQLDTLGHEVMAVDHNEDRVNDALPFVTNAQIGDSTNAEFLASLGIGNYDLCIVAIGNDFQSSLETTSNLKELGAKLVVARASRDVHAKFLLRNGADAVIYPEKNMAERYAVTESSEHIFDYIDLGSDYSIFEIDVLGRWVGKTVKELNFRVKYNLVVLATKKNGEVKPVITGERRFEKDEHLLVLGREEDVRKLTK